MSESEPRKGYRISRALNSVDRDIRLQKRDHAGEGEIPPFEQGEGMIDHRAAGRSEEKARRFRPAPMWTPARMLLSDGIQLPSPERLQNGREVQTKLWEVINGLALRRVYLRHTNHLTDRELYAALWTVHLNEVTRTHVDGPGSPSHIDLLECGEAAEGRFLHNGIEAAEPRCRQRDSIPERTLDRRNPRYDRDRYLPKEGPW